MDVRNTIEREPVALSGAVVGVVIAGVALLTAFGINVTEAQATGIVGFVSAGAVLGSVIYARRKVTPIAPGNGKRMKLDTE